MLFCYYPRPDYQDTHRKQGHSGTWVRSDMCFEFLHLLVFLRKLLQSCIVVTISFLHFLFFKHLFDIRSWLLNLYQTSSTISFTFPFSWTSDPEMEPETKWSGSKEMMWKERAFMKSHIAQIQIHCTNTKHCTNTNTNTLHMYKYKCIAQIQIGNKTLCGQGSSSSSSSLSSLGSPISPALPAFPALPILSVLSFF